MKTTKNRLFKTLVAVMLLFIMAFAVASNVFAESSEVSAVKGSVNVYYTQKTVTVYANYDCDVQITIKVKDGQNNYNSTVLLTLINNETKELTINDFVSDRDYDEPIITELVSVRVTKCTTNNMKLEEIVVLVIFAVLIIIIFALIFH